MDLTTRCPHCGTVFQASLPDLQLRKGYIRCVQCAHIFDGYAEVVQDPSAASVPPEREADLRAPDRPWRRPAHETVHTADFQIGDGIGSDAGLDDDGDRSTDPTIGEPASEPEVYRASRGVQWVSGPPPSLPDSIVIEAHPQHFRGGSAAPPLRMSDEGPGFARAAGRLLAWVSFLLLAALFAAQLVYVYRAQLAQRAPQLRPLLEQACESLRCRVPYARDASAILITGSALKVADTGAPPEAAAGADPGAPEQHFMLQLTLRNQLDQPQEWPNLVLDLKDGSGVRLVRRDLSPKEYLGDAAASRPFAAHSDALVRVPLMLSGVRINGYQLDLFFP